MEGYNKSRLKYCMFSVQIRALLQIEICMQGATGNIDLSCSAGFTVAVLLVWWPLKVHWMQEDPWISGQVGDIKG